MFNRAEERLLSNLLGILVLPDDPASNAEHLPLVFHEQRLHRRKIASLGLFNERSIFIACVPLFAQRVAETLVEIGGQLEGFLGSVELDRLSDVVDNDLAGITVLQMFLERAANAGLQLTVHILVQSNKQFLARHRLRPSPQSVPRR